MITQDILPTKMKLDLNTGVYIQISGELGKYNSIPIETLIKIAQDLQELVVTIAKYDLPESDILDLNNFKIELFDFKKGSAVPKFAFTPRDENKIGINWLIHRKLVTEKFENLIEVSNSGDYTKIFDLYPEPIARNPIVENLYAFVNDFGSAPVNFVDFDDKTEKITPIFKINRFKPATRKELITVIKELKNPDSESNEAVGKIKITTKGGKIHRKIIDTYSKSKYSLEYAPVFIITDHYKYLLKHPLRCLFEKEDHYYVIQSEMLGIIGTGLTEDEAEKSFAEEFEYIYQRFNSLENSSLINHNLLIKNILNQLVEKVEE